METSFVVWTLHSSIIVEHNQKTVPLYVFYCQSRLPGGALVIAVFVFVLLNNYADGWDAPRTLMTSSENCR